MLGLSQYYQPTKVDDDDCIYAFPPGKQYQNFKHLQQVALGKWMVFRPFTQLDETWHTIRREVEAGVLAEKTLAAVTTTLFYQPSAHGPGPHVSGVICVYTTEQDVEEIGFILINLVKHDIKFKTEEATNNREYAWRLENKSICLKTLYWNDGKPSSVLERELCHGPDCYRVRDIWHINCITSPASTVCETTAYGRWVISPKSWKNLTSLWHFLKEIIEEGILGPVEMVCPPKLKWWDKYEEAVFLVYTARKNKERVGFTLAMLVETDIKYELNRMLSREKPVYNHRIVWNTDEPVYVMTLIRH